MTNVLSPQMVEALHDNVELSLGFAYHGKMVDPIVRPQRGLLRTLGPAVLGVTDADFATVHDLIDPLQPGDLFCRESYAGRQADEPALTISHLDAALRRSVFVGERNTPTRAIDAATKTTIVEAICLQASPDDTEIVSRNPKHASAVLEGVELLRRYQILSPLIGYADSLAVAKGVRVQVADSPPEHFTKRSERNTFRDADMARAIGEAAISMEPTGSSRKPILAFAAGSGHKGVKKIMRAAGVPFTSLETHQSLTRIARRQMLLTFSGHAMVTGFPRQWERNANRRWREDHIS